MLLMLVMKVVLLLPFKIIMKHSFCQKKLLERLVMKVRLISVWMLLQVNSSWMVNMIQISRTQRMMEVRDYQLKNCLTCTQVSFQNTLLYQSKILLIKMTGMVMLNSLKRLVIRFKSQEMIYWLLTQQEFKKLLIEKLVMLYY